MKSQNSEVYFLAFDTSVNYYWYGMYDYTETSYSLTGTARRISDILFTFIVHSALSSVPFERLAEDITVVHQQFTPFDLTYLQTYYPEHLI